MSDPTRKSLLLPISIFAGIIVLLIVGFVLFPKGRPPTIAIEVTGEEGKKFFGTFTIEGEPQKRSGTIPATFTFQTNSISYVIVPAKNEQDDPEIAVIGIKVSMRENDEDRGSASGIHGIKASFDRSNSSDRTSSSLKVGIGSLTPEEQEAELATHR